MVSHWGETEEGSNVSCPIEARLVIQRCDVRQRHDRPDAWYGHQSLCEITPTRDLAQFIFHRLCCRAECLVDRIEGVRHKLDCEIGLTCFGQLITEPAALAGSMDRRHPDAEGLEHPANVRFQVLAHPNQALARADQDPHPL